MTYNAFETMKTIRFGIEIETIRAPRETVARAIQTVTGGTVHYIGRPSCYDPWEVRTADGRVWKVMRDGSLSDYRGGAEIVTPICTYDDLETIQQVVRAVRAAGAKVDESCGIHIHIDGGALGAGAAARLAKQVYSQEDLIVKALQSERRVAGYGSVPCRQVGEAFIQRLSRCRNVTMDSLSNAWYDGSGIHRRGVHYDNSRYAGLNMHSLFYRGTVEFRYFSSTLHAGKVKSYLQLCLALAAKAINSRGAVARKRSYNQDNPRYAFRTFLIRLGLNGAEFKTLRHHLLNHLPGNAAWAGERRPNRASASVNAPVNAPAQAHAMASEACPF